ncbi:MAG: hypothetical protein O2865_00400 [Planctomycetota bacterium]|nr:hypothetical protein [Planctomycetota bacterium]MDA1220840.1 hypothetical protein [Planctomycetota bacterium]
MSRTHRADASSVPPRAAWRARSWVIASLALLVALLASGPAPGDVTRNGGIIILPAPTHAMSWGKSVRQSYGFAAGQDVVFQMDPRMSSALLIACTGPTVAPVGNIQGQLLTVRSRDLRALKGVGIDSIRLQVVGAGAIGYDLWFDMAANGNVTVTLR